MNQGATQYSFGTFSWLVAATIIVVIFCIMYLYVRRKGKPRDIDKKAGDEGED